MMDAHKGVQGILERKKFDDDKPYHYYQEEAISFFMEFTKDPNLLLCISLPPVQPSFFSLFFFGSVVPSEKIIAKQNTTHPHARFFKIFHFI